MNIVCFHNPDEENGYLSNWYLSDFIVDGIKFTSNEQYMMYKKAKYFNDEKIAKEILSIEDVKKIKELGRKVSNYNDHMWNGVRQIYVYEGLYAKFNQNEELKNKLLNTKDSILAECAIHDLVWGIGLGMDDPDRLNIYKWRGSNLLGYSLMLVRDKMIG